MLLGSQVEGLTREYGKMKVIGGLDGGHKTRPEGADKRMNDEEVKAGSTSNLLIGCKGRQELSRILAEGGS